MEAGGMLSPLEKQLSDVEFQVLVLVEGELWGVTLALYWFKVVVLNWLRRTGQPKVKRKCV
jgi:hypothetical protein